MPTADTFEAIREIQQGAKKGYLSLLYLYDSSHGDKVKKFEGTLFQNEDLGVALKVFRCLKLDLARNQALKDLHGDAVPRFIVFDAKGKRVDEVHLRDYSSKAGDLMKALVKASRGHGKMPLKTFVKKYRSFLNELDQIEGKKGNLARKKQRARDHAGKLRKVEKEEQELTRREAGLMKKEEKLLAAVKAYSPDTAGKKRAAAAAPAPAPGGS